MITFSISGTDKGIDEEEDPLEGMWQVNAMVRSLINEVPSIKLGPWTGSPTKKDNLITEFQEDLDVPERYVCILTVLFTWR